MLLHIHTVHRLSITFLFSISITSLFSFSSSAMDCVCSLAGAVTADDADIALRLFLCNV